MATVTKEQLVAKIRAQEIDLIRRGRHDPVIFARSLKILNKDGKLVPFVPDLWQEEVLRSRSTRIVLNCCRQSGKSTVMAILALHRALYFPGQVITLISKTRDQTKLLLRKVQDFIQNLPVKAALDGESKTILEFANGSRIVALPGNEANIRGFAANLILED